MGFLSRIRRLVSGQTQLAGGIMVYAPVSGDIVAIEKVPDVVLRRRLSVMALLSPPKAN